MRACAVETHVKISQEPLHTEIYRKNAVPQNEPRTPTHILCEPAQSKRISRFHKNHFMRKLTGKMPQTRVSTLIKHRPLHLITVRTPQCLSVDSLLGEKCQKIKGVAQPFETCPSIQNQPWTCSWPEHSFGLFWETEP